MLKLVMKISGSLVVVAVIFILGMSANALGAVNPLGSVMASSSNGVVVALSVALLVRRALPLQIVTVVKAPLSSFCQ